MIGQVIYGALDLTDMPYVTDPLSDLGAPAPDLATVSRLLADGDVVAGARSGNRQVQLRVTVVANSRAEFAAAEAALFVEADKPVNTLTVLFGAGDGLPVAVDTYRGTLTPTFDANVDYAYTRSYALTCAAEPFFRSPAPITIAPSSAATVVDGFDSLTGMTTSGAATVDTTTFVTSTGSVRQPLTVDTTVPAKPTLAASWARTISPLDVSADQYVLLWLLTDYPFPDGLSMDAKLTLSSAGGRSSTWQRLPTPSTGTTGWVPVTWDLTYLPQAVNGGVDLTAVTGWEVEIGPFPSLSGDGPFTVWADDLSAYPHGTAAITAGSGQFYFAGIAGAARTAVTVEIDTNGAGGLLLANTPNAPVGYDPVLQAVSGVGASPITVTRKAVTLRRTPPETSTYIVMLYGQIAGGTYTATATVSNDPTAVVSSCSRTVDTSDPDYRNRNSAGYALFAIGELTLPPTDVDPQNTAADVTITISFGSHIYGAWLVWSGGENLLAFLPDGEAQNFFLDAPVPGQLSGKLIGSALGHTTRADGYDLSAVRVGTPIVTFDPGANHLLAVAVPPDSAPTTNPTLTADLTYFSRWLTERTS